MLKRGKGKLIFIEHQCPNYVAFGTLMCHPIQSHYYFHCTMEYALYRKDTRDIN